METKVKISKQLLEIYKPMSLSVNKMPINYSLKSFKKVKKLTFF